MCVVVGSCPSRCCVYELHNVFITSGRTCVVLQVCVRTCVVCLSCIRCVTCGVIEQALVCR